MTSPNLYSSTDSGTEPAPALSEGQYICLNCDSPANNKYCSTCGQKQATPRLTMKHFVRTEFLGRIWHIERGLLQTGREVLLRPGYAALDYIRGRRTGKLPVLTFLFMLIAALLWVRSLNNVQRPVTAALKKQLASPFMRMIQEEGLHNVKWLLVLALPIAALCTLSFFQRLKLNYAEHLIISCYVLAGSLIVSLAMNILYLFIHQPFTIFSGWVGLPVLGFCVAGYWQAFHGPYQREGFTWRLLLTIAMMAVLLLIVAVLIIIGAALWVIARNRP